MLEGSCECGAVTFSVESSTPYPYRVCYCRRCRKLGGAIGAAINVIADAPTLKVEGELEPTRYETGEGPVTAFCPRCGSPRNFGLRRRRPASTPVEPQLAL